MRAILVATFILVVAFIIKEDVQHGTLQLASFYQEARCEEEYVWQTVRVKVAANDTIYSLFAATPSPIGVTFPERLTMFYKVNPHLLKQTLLPNEVILLPVYTKATNSCRK